MTYQVLARKWRPQAFDSLIGQEPIVTALQNALAEGRIAQAYLFSGIRGVGKTTAARLLAKALNCEKGPAPEPCNECTMCLEITAGSDLDVLEVDAATYSKVDQVRELTESLRYGPARDRYKVVVLDEVHRLSRQAFDALLKIIEEPPPHLVFIFATTEIDAVPATILSRCQEFHFRRVASPRLAAYLRTLAEAEDIEASDTALRLVARAGEGSVRDAVALLDQLATFGSGTVADEDAARLLGGMDSALFETVLAAILGGDRAALGDAVRRMDDEGWDPRHVYAQFLGYCRDALHLALGDTGDARVDLPAEEAERLASLASDAGYENLLRLLHQLLASEQTVRHSDAGTLALEIAWLRAAELPRLRRIEDLLSGRLALPEVPRSGKPSGASPASSSPSSSSASSASSATSPRATDPRTTEVRDAGPNRRAAVSEATPLETPRRARRDREAPAPRPEAEPKPVDDAPDDTAPTPGAPDLDRFLDTLGRHSTPLAALLRSGARLSLDGGGGGDGDAATLVIAHPRDHDSIPRRMAKGHHRKLLEAALEETFGADATWRLEPTDQAPPAREAPSPADSPADVPRPTGGPGPRATGADRDRPSSDSPVPSDHPALDHPVVQKTLEIFGGTVREIEPRRPTGADAGPGSPTAGSTDPGPTDPDLDDLDDPQE